VPELAHRSKKLNEFLRARISPESFVGLQLTAGLVAFAFALVLFAVIAVSVAKENDLTQLDTQINVWLHLHITKQLTHLFKLISKLHSDLIVAVVTLALCAYLWFRHLRYWFLAFISAVFGGMLLNVVLKNLFVRSRPHFDDSIRVYTTFSFPSGHTMLATVFYGVLCAFVVSRLRGSMLRGLAILLAMFMIVLVGFGRMYLGVHYFSDVLGAMAEGSAWLALCFLIVGLIRNSRRSRAHRPAS
jgi:undecaprenyl-diphosphatase